MPELTLRFTSPLPLHSNQRLHRAQKAQRIAEVRTYAETMARRAKVTLPDPCRCIVKIGWPTRHRRDDANAHDTVKAAVDGIVRAGWLVDDSNEHLQGPDLRGYYLGRKGCVEMTFCFVAVEEAAA